MREKEKKKGRRKGEGEEEEEEKEEERREERQDLGAFSPWSQLFMKAIHFSALSAV